MPNGIKNATALDGATDWTIGGTGVSSSAIVADEEVRGSPGRAVVKGTGTVAVAGNRLVMASSDLQFAPGELIEAFAHYAARRGGAPAPARLSIAWFNAGDGLVSLDPLAADAAATDARRGLPATFAFTRVRLAPPATAIRARLEVSAASSANAQAVEVDLLKPFLGGVASGARPPCWTPGPHTNPDLDLDSWPDSLPDFRELDSPRTPTRTAFSTDSQIPAGRRFGTRGRIRFTGELALTLEQRDTLDQFVESRNLLPESAPFWFVHPDTRQLTRAWIDPEDGEPSDSGRGRDRRTRVGLMLEIA